MPARTPQGFLREKCQGGFMESRDVGTAANTKAVFEPGSTKCICSILRHTDGVPPLLGR